MVDMKCVIFLVAIGLTVSIVSIGFVVGQDDGYWYKTNTELKLANPYHSDTEKPYLDKSGTARYISRSPDGKQDFIVDFTWTVPEDKYQSEEHFKFPITAEITKYTWKGGRPDLDHPKANIGMGFLPGIPFCHQLENEDENDKRMGKCVAEVYGDLGKKTKEFETLTVSGQFYKGYKNKGDEKIYVQCNAGQVIYTYRWIDATDVNSQPTDVKTNTTDYGEDEPPDLSDFSRFSDSNPPGKFEEVIAYTTGGGYHYVSKERMKEYLRAGKWGYIRSDYREVRVPACFVEELREKYGKYWPKD